MDAFLLYVYDLRALVLVLVGVVIGLLIARHIASRHEIELPDWDQVDWAEAMKIDHKSLWGDK